MYYRHQPHSSSYSALFEKYSKPSQPPGYFLLILWVQHPVSWFDIPSCRGRSRWYYCHRASMYRYLCLLMNYTLSILGPCIFQPSRKCWSTSEFLEHPKVTLPYSGMFFGSGWIGLLEICLNITGLAVDGSSTSPDWVPKQPTTRLSTPIS